MLLVAVSETKGPLTDIELAEISINPNHWYQLDVDFTNEGSGQMGFAGSFFDLGANGTGTPALLSTVNWSNQNFDVADLTSAYAGFSALTDGGISRIDNF